mgnify:FL=1
MAENNLPLTGLSFDAIRLNLRNYIAAKPEFTDYDFNDSAIGSLLDLLAYNTYYNAFYANMAANEGFLDTAQLYENVVSRAKALGYVPSSARSAQANLKIIFTTAVANTTFRTIRIPKNTTFTSAVNGITYFFVTPQTYTVAANSTNGFADFITLKEGTPLTHTFAFNRTSNTEFILPNDNVDTSSITVQVTTSGNTQTYIPADDITTINSSSQIFFIDADKARKYKVVFGDGVLGNQPETGASVEISYRVCSGSIVNGTNNFTSVNATIGGQLSYVLLPIGRAENGANPEQIESVRFNAPRLYETQNRTVTLNDYERIAKRENPDIEAVSIWGGEDNVPPIYGKVFIAAKPIGGTTFSTSSKERIRTSIRKYNVQSIDCEIVDPTYLYIIPSLTVRYNPDATNIPPKDLGNQIANQVVAFESEYLNAFGRKFRYSKFLESIDSVDASIVSSSARIRLRKTFIPSLTNVNTYIINFNCALQNLGTVSNQTYSGYGAITSSTFIFNGQTSYFDDDGFGTLRVYYLSATGTNQISRIYTNYNAGSINYDSGIVTINNFLPTSYSGQNISIIAAPINPEIVPIRNQILLMSQSEVSIVNDITGRQDALVSNIETIGKTAIILQPQRKLYNF